MSLRFFNTIPDGTYNVRESETCIPIEEEPSIRCRVFFLDDTQETFEVERKARGQVLLDKVMEHLELVEKGYFGLQFSDNLIPGKQGWKWLDPLKAIRKQAEQTPYPFVFYFKVKFFAAEPNMLHEEYTRYHFFLHLRKDLQHDRLLNPNQDFEKCVLLSSYVLQSELGDFDCTEHGENYVSQMCLLPGQGKELEIEIANLHKSHKGQTPADAEYNFLCLAKGLDLYGIEPYEATDSNSTRIQIGVGAKGVVVLQNRQKINTFNWSCIVRISFKKDQFLLSVLDDVNQPEEYGKQLKFTMSSSLTCKNLWKLCIENHTFFRLLQAPPALPKKNYFFNFGSRQQYRYSGRTEHQTILEYKKRTRIDRIFTRNSVKGSSCKTASFNSYDQNPRNSLVNSGNQKYFGYNGNAPTIENTNQNVTYPNGSGLGNGRRSLLPNSFSAPFASTRHYDIKKENLKKDKNNQIPKPKNESSNQNGMARNVNSPTNHKHGLLKFATTVSRSRAIFGAHDKKTAGTNSIASRTDQSESEKGTLNRHHHRSSLNSHNGDLKRSSLHFNNSLFSPPNHTSAEKRFSNATTNRSANNTLERIKMSVKMNGNEDEMNNTQLGSNLVSIRMKSDFTGKFGFNIKGGFDQELPVIVSRIAAQSPADLAYPRLNEGDQIVKVNGKSVDGLTHEQIIKLITASNVNAQNILTLLVIPNVYVGDLEEEVSFGSECSISNFAFQISPSTPAHLKLAESMKLLEQNIENNSLIQHFQQLYRRKPGLTSKISKMPENICLNRYRDISPYDQTRVALKNSACGSTYINANHINMEIANTGIVNRYIAAQGPLPHTSSHFWQMIWEQQSFFVVMLTTQIEQGRIKCHQYWPNPGSILEYPAINLVITCTSETDAIGVHKGHYLTRTLNVYNTKTKEEREIIQLQYLSWPDHGVPMEYEHFLGFVFKFRKIKSGISESTIIHCSAGIGRTGVLILMETALNLIEANQPVYPWEIVKTMRDQRSMLIQTSTQYKFVCEALIKAWKDGLSKPCQDLTPNTSMLNASANSYVSSSVNGYRTLEKKPIRPQSNGYMNRKTFKSPAYETTIE